ncbi:DUF1707 domain-containing protein [Nocardia sp. R6R-6]|uniref:DUF1707 domain-containing protein n=1 Tax=Nocardia sp. R6R-6 TaxID=3459303 RepID=UPI00403D9EFA
MRGSGSGGSYPGHTKARDVDRTATGELLDRARAEGQLSEEEHDILVELVAQARTLGRALADAATIVRVPGGAGQRR